MPYPFPFPEHPPPTTFRDVPIFLRKSYHTDYIDVVPPQKITKKNTARFTIYCMYLPPPPSDAPEGAESNSLLLTPPLPFRGYDYLQ